MKKFLIVLVLIVGALTSCSGQTDTLHRLSEDVVAPYELSESDTYLLQSLGLSQKVNIVAFKAPLAAKSLKVNVYLLNKDGSWDIGQSGQVSLGADAEPKDRLEGTFTMLLKDDYAFDYNINAKGIASYSTAALKVDFKPGISTQVFLSETQNIELDKEIPVAIMVYSSGNSMYSFTTQDFFMPSKFAEMNLVQAVTLTFAEGIE